MDNENKKTNKSRKSNVWLETAEFGARALAQGFLTGLGLKLGGQLVERLGSSKKQRVSVADLRKNT